MMSLVNLHSSSALGAPLGKPPGPPGPPSESPTLQHRGISACWDLLLLRRLMVVVEPLKRLFNGVLQLLLVRETKKSIKLAAQRQRQAAQTQS